MLSTSLTETCHEGVCSTTFRGWIRSESMRGYCSKGLRAVLNESTAIGTFLLIPLTVQTFARNGYGGGRGLQRGRSILLSRTRLRASTQRFIVPACARDLGACQSIYGSAEQGDSGRKNRRPTRFGTMAAECHEANVQHVRDVAATNSRAVAFQPIVGKHVRNGARKVRP